MVIVAGPARLHLARLVPPRATRPDLEPRHRAPLRSARDRQRRRELRACSTAWSTTSRSGCRIRSRSTTTSRPERRRIAKGTVGLRLRVTRFDARAKLSQNKSDEVRATIIEQLLRGRALRRSRARRRDGTTRRPRATVELGGGEHDALLAGATAPVHRGCATRVVSIAATASAAGDRAGGRGGSVPPPVHRSTSTAGSSPGLWDSHVHFGQWALVSRRLDVSARAVGGRSRRARAQHPRRGGGGVGRLRVPRRSVARRPHGRRCSTFGRGAGRAHQRRRALPAGSTARRCAGSAWRVPQRSACCARRRPSTSSARSARCRRPPATRGRRGGRSGRRTGRRRHRRPRDARSRTLGAARRRRASALRVRGRRVPGRPGCASPRGCAPATWSGGGGLLGGPFQALHRRLAQHPHRLVRRSVPGHRARVTPVSLTVPSTTGAALRERTAAGSCRPSTRSATAATQRLDAFEARRLHAGSIEHAQLAPPRGLAALRGARRRASVQPEHAMDDRDVADRYWAGRTDRAFCPPTLPDAGADSRSGPTHRSRRSTPGSPRRRGRPHARRARAVAPGAGDRGAERCASTGGRCARCASGGPADLVVTDSTRSRHPATNCARCRSRRPWSPDASRTARADGQGDNPRADPGARRLGRDGRDREAGTMPATRSNPHRAPPTSRRDRRRSRARRRRRPRRGIVRRLRPRGARPSRRSARSTSPAARHPAARGVDVDSDGTRVFSLTPGGRDRVRHRAWRATPGYNGTYLGPTLGAERGETVRVHLATRSPDATTVHWHGMHLPPRWTAVLTSRSSRRPLVDRAGPSTSRRRRSGTTRIRTARPRSTSRAALRASSSSTTPPSRRCPCPASTASTTCPSSCRTRFDADGAFETARQLRRLARRPVARQRHDRAVSRRRDESSGSGC